MISKRLLSIANEIPIGTNFICDIGTDHAFLPIYLINHKIIMNAIATDINVKPLLHAQKNINKYKKDYGSIELINSPGLNWISFKKNIIFNFCIISGMGAATIINILKNDNKNIKQYIICSNNKNELIRKWIKKNRFYISKEIFIKEKGIIYIMIIINKLKGIRIVTNNDLFFGPYFLKNKNKLFYDFWKNKLIIYENILFHLPNNNLKYKMYSNIIKNIKSEIQL